MPTSLSHRERMLSHLEAQERDMTTWNADEVECAADALRRYEQSGRIVLDWERLPTRAKGKWRLKATVVLDAAVRERSRQERSQP